MKIPVFPKTENLADTLFFDVFNPPKEKKKFFSFRQKIYFLILHRKSTFSKKTNWGPGWKRNYPNTQ